PTPASGTPAGFADSERRWLVPTLVVVLVAVALGVAGLLLQGSGNGIFGADDDSPPTTEAPAASEQATITASTDFDPEGDGSEHPEEAQAGNAFDDDASTSWSSESYSSSDWGGLKPGVGLILTLDEAGPIGSVEFDTPLSGWQAEVFVAGSPQDSLSGWGEPVGSFSTSDSGTNTVDLGDDVEGGAVLLWFTQASSQGLVTVDEVRVLR
ncbi:MAG TPA: hypothetical protein VJM49_22305, partial [Acidimicrobiales bacterium]|nr:hypothetical protein [Acidimicrobiales bacterium]